MRFPSHTRPVIAAIVVATAPGAVSAQLAPGLRGMPARAAWVQVQIPQFAQADRLSAQILQIGARQSLTPSARFVVAVPVVRSTVEGAGDFDGTLIGNPYLGVEFGRADRTRVSLGVRVPVVPDDAPNASQVAGAIGDFENFEAYLHDVPSAGLHAAHRLPVATGVFVDAGLGAVAMKPREGDMELFGDYYLGVGLGVGAMDAMVTISGRADILEDELDFGERTNHQLTIAGMRSRGAVRPTAFLRVPLDEPLSAGLNMVFGAGVVVAW